MSQKFKSDIETQAGLIDSFGFSGSAGQILSSTGTKTEWITPPQSPGGGGSSQVFYFNGGTASSVGGYYQMSPVANTSTGVDFTINANGYIASFLTDVNSPNQLNIPAGNWNFEIYFSASSGGGSPSFYVELYKYSSSTFTLIASSSATPEGITNGTAIDLYITALAVPTTTLLATDRLAVRVYVTHSGRTIKMHTQNGHLSEVITTFSTGLTALNGLTEQVQYFATGAGGTDFNIASAVNTHTFNLPTASATNRGALSSADWTTFNSKANASGTTNYVSKFTGTTTLGDSQIFDNGTNVGLGTTTPGAKLDVSSGNINLSNSFNLTARNNANTFNIALIGRSSTDRVIIDADGYGTNIGGGGTVLINPSGGNVGIGTTSPASKLNVLGSGTTAISISNSNAGTSGSPELTQLNFLGFLQENRARIEATDVASSANGSELRFYNANTSNVLTERMRIASNGAVKFNAYGSGTFTGTATQKLAVDSSGNIIEIPIGAGPVDGSGTTNYVTKWTDADTIGNSIMYDNGTNIGIGTTSAFSKVEIAGAATSWSNSPAITFTDNAGTVNSRRWLIGNVATDYGSLNFAVSTTNSDNPTNPKMTITKEGNVGIGTTSPQAKLHLNNGTDRNLWFRVNGSGTGTELLSINDAQSTRQSLAFSASSFYFDNGNVGIGTTSPNKQLTFAQDDDDAIQIRRFTTSQGNPSVGTGISWTWADASTNNETWAAIRVIMPGSGNSNMTFSTTPGGGASGLAERMRITDTGNVGIGTSAPARLLELSAGEPVLRFNPTTVSGAYIFSAADGKFYFTPESSYVSTMTFSSGNVGIGTTSPSAKLVVSNGGVAIQGDSNPPSSGYGLEIFNSSTTSYIGSYNRTTSAYRNAFLFANDTIFENGGNERMRITSGGNVGIGTSSPSYKTVIHSSSVDTDVLCVSNDQINADSAQHFVGISLQDQYSNGSGNVSAIRSYSNLYAQWGSTLTFSTTGTAGNGIYERMRITNTGNVGIGNTNPGAKLDVSGNIFCRPGAGIYSNVYSPYTGNMTIELGGNNLIVSNGNVGIGTTSPGYKLEVNGGNLGSSAYSYVPTEMLVASNGNGEYFEMGSIRTSAGSDWTTAGFRIQERIDSTWMGYMQFNGDGNLGGMSFGTGTSSTSRQSISERMRILSNGNVGIGTSAPNSLLSVAGNATFGQGANRPVTYDSNGGNFRITPNSGGWATGYLFNGSAGTFKGGFGGFGSGDTLSYLWIGDDYNIPTITVMPNQGNVGIGTTSPTSKLHLQGTNTNITITDTTYNRTSNIGYIDNANLYLANDSSSNTYIGRYNNVFLAYGGGNVGIGTTSPSTLLHLYKTSYPVLTIDSGTIAGNVGIDTGNSFLNVGTTSNHPLVFGTNNSEKVRITSAGNVGIGTSSPSSKLQVDGAGYSFITGYDSGNRRVYIGLDSAGEPSIQGALSNGTARQISINPSGGNVGIGTTSPSAAKFVLNSGTSNQNALINGDKIGFTRTSDAAEVVYFKKDTSLGTEGTANINGYDGIQFRTQGAESVKAVITSAGNVGIGTSSPSQKLDVNGDALINGLTVGRGGGNISTNTVIGNGALASTSSGGYNIAIGYIANSNSNVSGLTAIGAGLQYDTNLNNLGGDCLAISQTNGNANASQVPHIYAPKPISIGGGATNIITFDLDHYAGAIVEYMIRLDDGNDYAVGTVYMGWKTSGSGNMIDKRQIEWSNMSGFVFSLGGSGQTLVLTNTSGNNAWIRITVRGMMTN